SSGVCNLEIKQQVTQQLNNGVYALFHLCKALMKERLQTPLKIVSVFSSHSEATAPLAAALGGFFKTLGLENPRFLAKVVDIQSGPGRDEASLAKKADLIWNEICEKNWTAQEIRYGNCMHEGTLAHGRYIREL